MNQKILDKKPKKDLDQKYLKIFHKYLKKFNKKQDTETEHTIDTEIVNIADCFFNFYDIRYDIDHNITPGIIFEWYWDNLTHRDINYENATKLFRIDSIKHFKEDLASYRNGEYFEEYENDSNKEKNLKIKLLSEIEKTIERTNLFISPPLNLMDLVVYLSETDNIIETSIKFDKDKYNGLIFQIKSDNLNTIKEFIIPESLKYNLDLRSQDIELIRFIHKLIVNKNGNSDK